MIIIVQSISFLPLYLFAQLLSDTNYKYQLLSACWWLAQLLSDIFLFAFPFALFASEDSSSQDFVFRMVTKEGTIAFLLWHRFHSFKMEPSFEGFCWEDNYCYLYRRAHRCWEGIFWQLSAREQSDELLIMPPPAGKQLLLHHLFHFRTSSLMLGISNMEYLFECEMYPILLLLFHKFWAS